MKKTIIIPIMLFAFFLIGMSFVQGALTDGIISYYKFDETSGTNVIDSVGYKNGTIVGSLTQNATGILGKAYNFGATGGINITGLSSNAKNYTISVWANPVAFQDVNRAVFDCETGRLALLINYWGGWCSKIGYYDGAVESCFNTAGTVGNLTHYVFVFDGKGAGNASLYINGNKETKTMVWVNHSLGGRCSIGVQYGLSADYFKGVLDELGIWGRTLSAEEITSLYNSGGGVTYPFSSVPTIVFNSQVPTDLNITNAQNNKVYISYNVTDADGDLNDSTVKLFYKANSTTDNTMFFLNGTAYAGYFDDSFSLTSRVNVSQNYTWTLLDNEIYPGTYNTGPVSIDNKLHYEVTGNNANFYTLTEYYNVSGVKQWGYFEIMANQTSGTKYPASVYYCNSSYTTGSILTNANCGLISTRTNITNYDHCHTNTSCHIGFQFAINTTAQSIANIKVTSTSYFVFGGASNWNVFNINEETRVGFTKTTGNRGVGWTTQNYSLDQHFHQFDLSDNQTFFYYVCANDTLSAETCSVIRNDTMELSNLPPSSPQVYSPIEAHYAGNIDINYTSSLSPNNITINYYNISLLNSDFTFNKTISANNSLNLNYLWDSSTTNDGIYIIRVETFDILGQTSFGYSENFTIDNTFPIEINVLMPLNDNTSRGNTNITLDITGSDLNLYGYNLSVFYSNGTLFFNETKVNLTPPTYTLNHQINFSIFDNYTITRCWADSHTLNSLPDAKSISYDNLNRKINYNFDKTQISVSLLNATDLTKLKTFETIKLKDRYTFTYDLSNDKTITEKTYVFRVISNERIYLIQNSKYPAHAVSGKYWVDFDIPNSKVKVIKSGEYFYDVEVITKDNKLISNSIGGLNEICFSGLYTYEKYAPSAPVIIVPVNTTYDNQIDISYTASISPNGDAINYYAIDLLNGDNTFNSTISANNSVNLLFTFNTTNLTDGAYKINISVFDINGLKNMSVSDLFSIHHIAPHIPPTYSNFTNNATSVTMVGDIVQYNITFYDNIQLLNYTFYVDGINYSNALINGTAQNVLINYLVGTFSPGDSVCSYFIVYDTDANSNTTENSCFTIYAPLILFSATSYGAILFIGFALLCFALLFFAEYINSPALRFISSISVIAFGIMTYAINSLFGGILIGFALLLIIRSFLWK
jgi:hypothetical protein